MVDMSLRHFRRQYEQQSQFERERIIGMMEVGWSARRVARQLGRSDCVTSRREDRHIVRNASLHPTASLAAIQAQEVPSIGAPVSGAAHEETGLQRNGTRSSLAMNLDTISAVMTIVFVCGDPVVNMGCHCLQYTVTPSIDRWPHDSPAHIWDHLGWRVGHPTSLNGLEARFQKIWNEVSRYHKELNCLNAESYRAFGLERVQQEVKYRPLRYKGDSIGTWQNLGDRTKLASFLVTLATILATLVTFLVSSGPSGFFWKFVVGSNNFPILKLPPGL
ncbi:transposable element Tcb2 transposase [Trichonephila clavipes]|nr:transposable element Tcb2 transposase [Trichonephila clavipes]